MVDRERSCSSRVCAVAICVASLATARAAAAQYSVQVLVAPDGISSDARTDSYAINNKGQVFGQVFVTAQDRRPLLWTGGQAQSLSVPAPYVWDGGTGGHQFLNDHGAAVAQVLNPGGLPRHPTLDQPLIIEWTPSGGQMVAQIVPLPPVVSCLSDYALALGFNNNGHVLLESGDAEGTCHRLWLWDGTGSAASAFTEVANLGDPSTGGTCPASYSIIPGASHLNDADHVALEFHPGTATPPCSTSFESGILASGVFTPLTTSTFAGGASQINNADQVVMVFNTGSGFDIQFWNGTAIDDVGFGLGVWTNDSGHLLYIREPGSTLQTRQNGVSTDVTLPSIPDFFEPSAGIGTGGLNTIGQLLLGGSFHMGGSPAGNLTSHPILLTPPAPTVTLKVNGQHPTPTPVVTTAGPMLLTLDMSNPGNLYTGTLSWYWALIVKNQVVWITAAGPSATTAPLVVLPPQEFTGAVLLNINLPAATTVTSLFLLVDANNALASFDIIAATRP